MEILKDMVKFFDQKEEVISIELTPYGKEKFASGSFSPKHYAFYDEAILYDGTYANIAESQNQIVDSLFVFLAFLHLICSLCLYLLKN